MIPLRLRFLIALAIVTALGIGTGFYDGPAALWVSDHLSGVLYVIFWILAVMLVRPDWPINRVAAIVFLATCAIEVLQLWRPPFLQEVRSTYLGATLLGHGFKVWDLVHYAIGALAGSLFVNLLRPRPQQPD